VRATFDLNQATSDISRVLLLQPVDASGNQVIGITLRPDRVSLTQKIVQRGGYRTLVVKVSVTGQLPNGYRLSNISAFPPTVTVFSTDPVLVANLPGYVETNPVNLSGAKDDLDTNVLLRLPAGISAVGDKTVQVQVGIATIDGSVTLPNMPVEIVGAAPDQVVKIAPERVDVIISGPLPILEKITPREVTVVVDVSGMAPGKAQRNLVVRPAVRELRVDSILPASVEVTIIQVTPTPTALATVTPTVTPTPRR
jgi:YbbR domain-containing protein